MGLLGTSRVLFEGTFIVFSAIQFSTKSTVASAVFRIACFPAVLAACVSDFPVHQKLFSILTAQTFVHILCEG